MKDKDMKKSKFARWYVKYIIKTPLVFYLFLSGGILLFLILSLSLIVNDINIFYLLFRYTLVK